MAGIKARLRSELPMKVVSRLPRSFDQVGSIAIVEVPRGMSRHQSSLARAILAANPFIKTVVKKVGGHAGKYRVQKYRAIGGVRTTVTEHRESGVRLMLDISKVYFSPRLGHDRLRISGMIKKGERVLVIGSGVGPYPLVIARHSSASQVVGVEANPMAHRYALANALLNRLERKVLLVRGDARRVVPSLGVFDRVLITAPHQSAVLLKAATSALKNGGYLHFYSFSKEDAIDESSREIVAACARMKCRFSGVAVVRCGQQSPRVWRVCLEGRVWKNERFDIE